MIDIHTHLLFGVDDGSVNLEESINQINKAYENGIKAIVLTPHYIEDSKYSSNLENNKKIFNILKSKITNVELFLGNECYITDDLLKLLKEKKITTINNSKYLLVEFPRMGKLLNLEEKLQTLINNDIIPIICHPERYSIYKENPKNIVNLINLGCLIQINAFSLLKLYGSDAKKTAMYFLKNEYVDFIATDIHDRDFYSSIKKLKKITNEEYFKKITITNPLKVINNEDIEKTYIF